MKTIRDPRAWSARRGATLLRGGLKLEIEGATNPAFFRRDHGRRLVETIRSTR